MDTYTVARPFKTRLRRFAAGQAVVAADVDDGSLTLADWVAKGFLAPAAPVSAEPAPAEPAPTDA